MQRFHPFHKTVSMLSIGFVSIVAFPVLFCSTLRSQDTPSSASSANDIPALPSIPREFRGAWVATVANIDWPTKPGLTTEEQQSEAIKILDRIVQLRMNVVVLQVRTSCDSLYESKLEPWSYFLTGEQGKAPEPYYDPLTFWIEESHRRGLELHAWFNPFRAKNSGQKYPDCDQHISKTHPNLVKDYGNDKTRYLWLDPGEEDSRAHSLRVFLDVVERYDVDGIHIDDYFYPYPVEDIPFPDNPAWDRYLAKGGKETRDDWRRQTMNAFIQNLYSEIKKRKKHVKFGISPFGIWKPGYPSSVVGFSQHDKLYADAKLWLNEGWCDYYAPQLYWSITAKQQSFPALLSWWAGENTKQRLLVPGIYTSRIGDKNRAFSVEQIESQVFTARHMPGSSGTIHFSMKALLENREGISDQLQTNTYLAPALVPESPWLAGERVSKPEFRVEVVDGVTRIAWQVQSPASVRQWCLFLLRKGKWEYQILGREKSTFELKAEVDNPIQAISVHAIDGAGAEGESALLVLE